MFLVQLLLTDGMICRTNCTLVLTCYAIGMYCTSSSDPLFIAAEKSMLEKRAYEQ